MPYADKERQRLAERMWKRKMRHGNFRQIFVDNGGLCQGILDDGDPCGAVDCLEYHELFGESKNGENKMQQRALLCINCHSSVNDGFHDFPVHRKVSRLSDDIQLEQSLVGGYASWLEKFDLVDRYQPITVEVARSRPEEE